MTTMTVCKLSATASLPAGCGRTCSVQTICVTGIGDSFSSCNSTIASVSSKLLLGSSMTRRKTFSGGSHATFNLGCHNELQDFATNRAGSDGP